MQTSVTILLLRRDCLHQGYFMSLPVFTFLLSPGFQVQYKRDYEKNKAQSDYNTLPATENPLLRQLRYAGTILSDVGIVHAEI